MSNSLSVASVIEKNLLSSSTPFLVALDVDVIDPTNGVVVETLHVVRNSEDIVFNGTNYAAASFDIELKAEAGAQQSISLSIKDFTRAIQARMQQYGGGVGFRVQVMIINGAALNSPPEITEYFEVIAANSNNYVCSFTLGSENPLTYIFPRRRQTRDFCQWRYKDPLTCGYSGGLTTCDLTLQGPNGCSAHNNTNNFGAYPGVSTNGIRYG